MILKNTKSKILMLVLNVLKFLTRTRINIIGFGNIKGNWPGRNCVAGN